MEFMNPIAGRATNPVTLKLRTEGKSVAGWARVNGENPNKVRNVIYGIQVNERIKAKLERDGLWELLPKRVKKLYPESKTEAQQGNGEKEQEKKQGDINEEVGGT